MLKKIKNRLMILTAIFGSISTLLNAQETTPFNCVSSAYLFQNNDVYAIDLASGNSFQVATDVTEGNINATAYNPADGYIWGSLTSPAKTIVRIGQNFTPTTYYIDELPSNNRYIGDADSTGIYYLKGQGTTYYKININPASVNYAQHEATESLSQNINIHDWAFNAVDGKLYSVEKNSNILYRINPEDGVVTSIGEVPTLAGNDYTYGAVYFDVDGRFYVSANQTGTIYVIQAVHSIQNPADIESNLFAFGPSSSSNDGARCPTAPVTQEICDNGIDDDGDGLVDCEDPSCSGFGICEVIEPPTSGGNEGGLESNNRLSAQISARNFKRVKEGYTFDRSLAPRVTRDLLHSQRGGANGISLQDFIPLNVIGESEAIESTPSDLVYITNATDVYALDYMNQDTPIATILALKTEDGVYEHTKYICDRLLGAQLISVSTMTINEQPFIKSIIRNEDGTYEFVLSFSAKLTNNEANFAIESHWNLDRYEENMTFYNFQIWTNSVDDLYLLGQELLDLLHDEKPIATYNISTPPTVFVRKGKYSDGALDLQIVNTNATEAVVLNAAYRTTETSELETYNSTLALGGEYITNLTVETGRLFDIGFRIGNDLTTADDLYMSEGPWGIDSSQAGTEVLFYNVTSNNFEFETTDFPIERNVELHATTNSYVAAFKALTPKFKAVNLTDYNSFKFSAKGTGNLEIAFVKESETNWEAQFKTTVGLTDVLQDYNISIANFQNSYGDEPQLNDVVTMVFTLVSEDGNTSSKAVNLENLRLSQENTSTFNEIKNDINALRAFPNPLTTSTTMNFTIEQNETVQLVIYDRFAKQVYHASYAAVAGKNSIKINKDNLSAGVYLCKIISTQSQFYPLKLMIN